MIEPAWLLAGILLPIVIVFLGLGLTMLLAPGRQHWSVALVGTVATAIAFVAGYWSATGWPTFPPNESQQRMLVYMLPAAAVVGLLASLPKVPRFVPWILRIATALAAPPMLLLSYIKYTWSTGEAVAQLTLIGFLAAAVWAALVMMSRRHPGGRVPTVVMFITGAMGITIMLSGSQTLGQYSLSLSASLAAIAGLSLVSKTKFSARGLVDVAAAMLLGLCIQGAYYADLTALNALLISTIPILAWLGELPVIRRRPAWQQFAVRWALVLLPLMIAVGLAAVAFAAEVNDTLGEYYGY